MDSQNKLCMVSQMGVRRNYSRVWARHFSEAGRRDFFIKETLSLIALI